MSCRANRNNLLHPSSFTRLLSLLTERTLNRMLSQTILLDVGFLKIYEDVYILAIKETVKKSNAEALVRSVKQIINAMCTMQTIPAYYLAITRFGRSTGLNFIDSAHVYISSKFSMRLITAGTSSSAGLSKYTKCIDVEDFVGSLMEQSNV